LPKISLVAPRKNQLIGIKNAAEEFALFYDIYNKEPFVEQASKILKKKPKLLFLYLFFKMRL